MSAEANLKPTIFREYIGVKPYPDNLTDFPADIINLQIPEFHFILGFATEEYDGNGRGKGKFNPTWNIDYFSPQKVKDLKGRFNNVKVVISIGGRGSRKPFDPAEKSIWPKTAIDSISEIIRSYGNVIDGIDINYEVIKSSETDFADCLGNVINVITKQASIKVVSIAPSNPVSSHYVKLYQTCQGHINWVNYQFSYQTVPSKLDFVRIYRDLENHYPAHKLLAGVSTDPNDATNMSREVFIAGCKELKEASSLPGICVSNANDSAEPKARPNEGPFYLEKLAQHLLVSDDRD